MNDRPKLDAVIEHMRLDLAQPPPAGIEPLLDSLRQRYGDALDAVLLYGSTRRSADPRDGLVDLLLLVRSYREVHGRGATALFNRLLPPNVYYLEAGPEQARLRCKYIVISFEHFTRRTAGGLDSYFWARFTQPCRLVWSRAAGIIEQVATCRARAALVYAREGAALGPGRLDALGFWQRVIRASYGCELRPEPPGAAAALIERDPEFWTGLSQLLLPQLDGVARRGEDFEVDPRMAAPLRWTRRRIWGRSMNVLRLLKAAGTFANGIDYLCWKLERHAGIRVEPTERMRRYPRLASWGLLFRLIRSGALR
ncbi:MAG: hypothetical protein CVV18_01545 [Gammaproteobacteria bacterium HGW-Gammaproteobacteria-8]|nr:MAG: hypothetical protein CVV18_01545 [Gammaproteobacteria bacterium HGW-Gammaproteobacteria-8]